MARTSWLEPPEPTLALASLKVVPLMSTLASSVLALRAPTIPRLHRQQPLVCTVQPMPSEEGAARAFQSLQMLPIFHGDPGDCCRYDCCADERGEAGMSDR